jgi:hypothetical protein
MFCGALDCRETSVHYVRVDHCRTDMAVPQQFLDRSYVVAHFQQMRRKTAQRMETRLFGNACP